MQGRGSPMSARYLSQFLGVPLGNERLTHLQRKRLALLAP